MAGVLPVAAAARGDVAGPPDPKSIDSWIAIFAEGKTVLNLNDCIFPKRDELRQMRTEFGEVDLRPR